METVLPDRQGAINIIKEVNYRHNLGLTDEQIAKMIDYIIFGLVLLVAGQFELTPKS